jgi:hypothetical protein
LGYLQPVNSLIDLRRKTSIDHAVFHKVSALDVSSAELLRSRLTIAISQRGHPRVISWRGSPCGGDQPERGNNNSSQYYDSHRILPHAPTSLLGSTPLVLARLQRQQSWTFMESTLQRCRSSNIK